jgi:hypothetical protein
MAWNTYQSSTTSNSPELARGTLEYTEDVDSIPVRVNSFDGKSVVASQADYHNPDMPRYVLHQSVHNMWCADVFDWETEQAFEVQRFDAQFGERYLAGVQSLPSYDESRLIYGR